MPRGHRRERTTVHSLYDRLIWYPTYRMGVLWGDVAARRDSIIEEYIEAQTCR